MDAKCERPKLDIGEQKCKLFGKCLYLPPSLSLRACYLSHTHSLTHTLSLSPTHIFLRAFTVIGSERSGNTLHCYIPIALSKRFLCVYVFKCTESAVYLDPITRKINIKEHLLNIHISIEFFYFTNFSQNNLLIHSKHDVAQFPYTIVTSSFGFRTGRICYSYFRRKRHFTGRCE